MKVNSWKVKFLGTNCLAIRVLMCFIFANVTITDESSCVAGRYLTVAALLIEIMIVNEQQSYCKKKKKNPLGSKSFGGCNIDSVFKTGYCHYTRAWPGVVHKYFYFFILFFYSDCLSVDSVLSFNLCISSNCSSVFWRIHICFALLSGTTI